MARHALSRNRETPKLFLSQLREKLIYVRRSLRFVEVATGRPMPSFKDVVPYVRETSLTAKTQKALPENLSKGRTTSPATTFVSFREAQDFFLRTAPIISIYGPDGTLNLET